MAMTRQKSHKTDLVQSMYLEDICAVGEIGYKQTKLFTQTGLQFKNNFIKYIYELAVQLDQCAAPGPPS